MPTTEPRFSINEIFGPTIQGEGALAGSITMFVRFNGCDYRCNWCDSLDAVLPERIKMHRMSLTATEIFEAVERINKNGCQWVTLSGGNPALVKNMDQIIDVFKFGSYRIAVETQGTIAAAWFDRVDHLVLSPKPYSSGHVTAESQVQECIWAANGVATSLKVVVFDENDLDYAARVHYRFPRVPFFVQVGTRGKGFNCDQVDHPSVREMAVDYRRIAEMVLKHPKLQDVKVLPQLHLYIFGHGRGV